MSDPLSSDGPDLPGMRCVELIGSGGFADVYVYERDYPKGRVAVKLMKASTLDPAKMRQFASEADTMAELAEHPFIVPVLGAGTAPDGRPYLVMRYYPSADLAVRVSSTPMSVPDALRYGIQLASAVETAHRAGIIHRDIKPSNILLSSYGQPGLSDFGIAGRPSDTGDDDDVGVSVPWSPPEVLSGASNGSVASDVYSLAATIWNLLVGRAPFHLPGGDNSERAMFTRIVHSRPPSTSRDDAPASLDRLLQQAMAKDPAYRPQSALELARHFQRVEQELRLARTEIFVLGQGGTATPVRSRTAPHDTELTVTGSAARTASESTNETRLKAPARARDVQSPSPAPPVSLPPPTTTAAPSIAASDLPPAPAEAETTLRPSMVAAQPAGPTDVRPRRAADPQPAHAPAPRPKRALLVGITIAGVLAVAVGVGVMLSRGGDDGRTPSASDPQPSRSVSVDEVVTGQLPDPTKVTGTVVGKSVVFRWPRVLGATAYIWRFESGGGYDTVREPMVKVPRAPRGETCIRVSTDVVGGSLGPGTRGCVR